MYQKELFICSNLRMGGSFSLWQYDNTKMVRWPVKMVRSCLTALTEGESVLPPAV